MEIFYSDKETTFKCQVEIDGASLNDSSVRLLLEFDNGITFLLRGEMDQKGKCKIKIPALKNTPSESGKAVLEIVADSTLFESWESKFNIKKSKNVSVTIEGKDDNEKIVKPTVKVVREEVQSISQEKPTITEAKKEIPKESFNTYLESFNKRREFLNESFKKFVPSKEIVNLLKEKNMDTTTTMSKIFMYYLDKRIIK